VTAAAARKKEKKREGTQSELPDLIIRAQLS
jgi:hypothetical protein